MRGVVIGLIMLVGLGREARASCTPTALLLGPDDIVATIAHTLIGRGIATEVVDGCPFVRATVAVSPTGLSVTIADPYGRIHDHLIVDTDVAATLIESWADPHQEAPLLAAREWARPQPKRVAFVDVDSEAPALLAVHATDPVRTLSGSMALESSFGSDGSTWWGAAAATCVRLGRICAGANVRLASDARLSGASEKHETGRTALDLLLAVDVPTRWGDLGVTWGAGLGVGWIRSSLMSSGGAVDIDTGGVRADAHVTFAFPITPTITAELRAVVNLSPLAHVGTYTEDGSTLAGEPRGFGRLSFGFRYGAR
jgi:hypothetical protein